MREDIEALRKFILANASRLAFYEGGGRRPRFPDFELFARDYLQVAELELETYLEKSADEVGSHHLINCVANLKRAMDCELDTFLYVFGLRDIFSERNLGFETRLKFLHRAGIFSARSLIRLNQIRNRMEHEYEIPKVEDLEAYFDLVSAFVYLLEHSTTFAEHEESIFVVLDGHDILRGVRITYDYEKPQISTSWGGADWGFYDRDQDLVCTLDQYKEFALLFRIMYALFQLEHFAGSRYMDHFLASEHFTYA